MSSKDGGGLLWAIGALAIVAIIASRSARAERIAAREAADPARLDWWA